jgi:hypothetical protein
MSTSWIAPAKSARMNCGMAVMFPLPPCNWDEAQRRADEGLGLSLAGGGQWLLAWLFRYHLGMLAAARGDLETARALADEAENGWAERRSG